MRLWAVRHIIENTRSKRTELKKDVVCGMQVDPAKAGGGMFARQEQVFSSYIMLYRLNGKRRGGIIALLLGFVHLRRIRRGVALAHLNVLDVTAPRG